MAHRNKWFTWVYLLKMVIFHGYVGHSQRVIIYIDSHGFRVPMISPVSHGHWMRFWGTGGVQRPGNAPAQAGAESADSVLTVMTCNIYG